MAITKSAKRAIRGSEKKKVYNERRKKTMKEAVKEVKILTVAKDKKTATELLSKAFSQKFLLAFENKKCGTFPFWARTVNLSS